MRDERRPSRRIHVSKTRHTMIETSRSVAPRVAWAAIATALLAMPVGACTEDVAETSAPVDDDCCYDGPYDDPWDDDEPPPDPRPACGTPPPAVCGNEVQEAGEECDELDPRDGSCVDCELLCAPSYASCNGDGADGCEADLGYDPLNCGTCGTVCDACVAGACTISTALATAQSTPWKMVADTRGVYWVTLFGGTVMGVTHGDEDGEGDPVVLADGRNRPSEIAIDDTYVYWREERPSNHPQAPVSMTLWRVPRDGSSSPAQLGDGAELAGEIAAGSKWVLFDAEGDLWASNATGTEMGRVSSGATLTSMFVDDGMLYTATRTNIHRQPIDCRGTPDHIWAGGVNSSIAAIHVHDEAVAVLSDGSIEGMSGGRAVVHTIDVASGAQREVFDIGGWVCSYCDNIAMTDEHIFVAVAQSGSGSLGELNQIWRIPRNGGPADLFAEVDNIIRDIEVVGDVVYWMVGPLSTSTGYIARRHVDEPGL